MLEMARVENVVWREREKVQGGVKDQNAGPRVWSLARGTLPSFHCLCLSFKWNEVLSLGKQWIWCDYSFPTTSLACLNSSLFGKWVIVEGRKKTNKISPVVIVCDKGNSGGWLPRGTNCHLAPHTQAVLFCLQYNEQRNLLQNSVCLFSGEPGTLG